MNRRMHATLWALVLASSTTMLVIAPAAGAAEQVVACGDVVAGTVKVANDLVCADTSALTVGADNTVIDMNGHTFACEGAGYSGSCQGGGDDVGIDNNGHHNVHVFSGQGRGTITGFDFGVRSNAACNVKIEDLDISGPVGVPGANPRPATAGIHISNSPCSGSSGAIVIGTGEAHGNDVSNHTEGIDTFNSSQLRIQHNVVHNNNSDPLECHGIVLTNVADSLVLGNRVTMNGENLPFDGGITLRRAGTVNNQVLNNRVVDNFGDGISTRSGASGNYILNNVATGNGTPGTFFDVAGRGAPANRWNRNNDCVTQNAEVPLGVCP